MLNDFFFNYMTYSDPPHSSHKQEFLLILKYFERCERGEH